VPDDLNAKKYVEAYSGMKSNYALYKKITAFTWLEEEWEGDFESLETEIKTILKENGGMYKRIAKLEHEITHQKSLINNDDTCVTCGQSVKHLHEKLNREATEKLELLEAQYKDLKERHSDQSEYAFVLDAISMEQVRRQEFEKFTEDFETLPWHLKWKGEKPISPDRTKLLKYKEDISNAIDLAYEVHQAKTKLKIYKESLIENKAKLRQAEIKCSKIAYIDTDKLTLHVDSLCNEVNSIDDTLKALATIGDNFTKRIDRIEAEKKTQATRIETYTQEIKSLNLKIKKDNKNGVLLKEMRKAKPLVLSKVWNRILVAVSSTFSQMRNETSVVVRKEKGFYINNLPVHRLSGSAKSILGIAVRQTLRDVFAPQAGPLIFDEPAADCDADRTAFVVSAIKAIPGQVIMITHEELSDMTADNIIEV